MDRRKFIHYSAAGAAFAATANKAMSAEHVIMNQTYVNKDLNVIFKTDVLVIGGGQQARLPPFRLEG